MLLAYTELQYSIISVHCSFYIYYNKTINSRYVVSTNASQLIHVVNEFMTLTAENLNFKIQLKLSGWILS